MTTTYTTLQKISLLILALLFAGVAGVAFAQESGGDTSGSASTDTPGPSITFPISELGDCGSKSECKLYCDDASHRDACFTFAQSHGLMNKDQVSTARVLLSKKGPGGCSNRESCKTYCDDTAHTDECIKFAESHKVVPIKQLEVIKKIRMEGGPGGCKEAEECKAYCSDTTHQDDCRAFAKNHDLTRPHPTSTVRMIERPDRPRNASSTEDRPGMHMMNGSTTRPCIAEGNCSGDSRGDFRMIKPGMGSSTIPRPGTPGNMRPPKPGGDGMQGSTTRALGAPNTMPHPPMPGSGSTNVNPTTGEPTKPPLPPKPSGLNINNLPGAVYAGFLYLIGR